LNRSIVHYIQFTGWTGGTGEFIPELKNGDRNFTMEEWSYGSENGKPLDLYVS